MKLQAFFFAAFVVSLPATADWLDSAIRMLAISKTPSAERSTGNEIQTGDIMLVPLAGGPPQALTSGGGYRSPVFLPDGKGILALSAEDLVHLPLAGGVPIRLRPLPGAVKLIGIDRGNPERVVLLLERRDGNSVLAVASLAGRTVSALPHNPASKDDRRLMSHLRGENREYDGVSVYLRPEAQESIGGTVEWTDVYATVGGAPPLNLSRCDGTPCAQPSISIDGKQVTFIRAQR